ncbi:hypothetical protein PG996_000206 [Apiospora saccharicola]|uniref:Uncharacterized protein n=1 Tax=Apiospora saccharicola TaxID=335842 RepID=A0ABR1WG26_9PEZI
MREAQEAAYDIEPRISPARPSSTGLASVGGDVDSGDSGRYEGSARRARREETKEPARSRELAHWRIQKSSISSTAPTHIQDNDLTQPPVVEDGITFALGSDTHGQPHEDNAALPTGLLDGLD